MNMSRRATFREELYKSLKLNASICGVALKTFYIVTLRGGWGLVL